MKASWGILLAGLFFAAPALADELAGDRLKIGVGGYALSGFDANITLEDADSGAGISISPIETLGMDFNTTVFRIDGGYRFTRTHSMQFSWYRIASRGTKVLGEDIKWDDITIPATATVSSELKYDIVKLGYLWSFYHNDKVEMGVGAGVHVTRLSLLMNATFAGSELETQDVNTTVPLPVVMFVIAYQINDKWRWVVDDQWFSMNFERIQGSYNDNTVRVEYQAWKNVSLGLGVGVNNLYIEDANNDYVFKYRNRIAGVMLYVAASY